MAAEGIAGQVVRFSRAGRVTGSGFIAAEGYILSAHHVLCEVLAQDEMQSLPENTRLPVELPLQLQQPLNTSLYASFPCAAQPGVHTLEDISLLQYQNPLALHKGTALSPQSVSNGQPVHVYGFNRNGGSWYQGHCLGMVAEGWVQVNLQNPQQEMLDGLSGAPVWAADPQNPQCLGMLVTKRHNLTAYMLPATRILAAWPFLAAENRSVSVSGLDALLQKRLESTQKRYDSQWARVEQFQKQYDLERPENKAYIRELYLKPAQDDLGKLEQELQRLHASRRS